MSGDDCACNMMKELGILFVEAEKPTPPPTHNDFVRAEGFATSSNKNIPDVKISGTSFLREDDDA